MKKKKQKLDKFKQPYATMVFPLPDYQSEFELAQEEISVYVKAPTSSISARLRDFRKTKFGGHQVFRRRRDPANSGVFEYALWCNKKPH